MSQTYKFDPDTDYYGRKVKSNQRRRNRQHSPRNQVFFDAIESAQDGYNDPEDNSDYRDSFNPNAYTGILVQR